MIHKKSKAKNVLNTHLLLCGILLLSACKKEEKAPPASGEMVGITSKLGPIVNDADGNEYKTIVLGNGQTWMKEDLRSTISKWRSNS